MQRVFLAGILTVSTVFAQGVPAPQAQTAPDQSKAAGAQDSTGGTITIPAGTKVPVSLTSPIIAGDAHKGDSVRVVTAFPVTVGTRLAIPAGTYLEGVIDKVGKENRSGQAHLEMHFTRMVYASGYEVALTRATIAARAGDLDERAHTPLATPNWGMRGEDFFGKPQQQQPTLPAPQPPARPSIGKVVGIGIGVTAVLAVVGIVLARRGHGGANQTVFETGTQFDLVFQVSVAVDGAKVAMQTM